MKRVTHTPFSTQTRPIGRDVEVTIALIQALGRTAAPNCGVFHRVIDTIKLFLK